jgi:hypothetical protein
MPGGLHFTPLPSVVHSAHAYMASFHYDRSDLAYSGIQVYIASGS